MIYTCTLLPTLSLELNVDKACRQVHMVYTCTLLPTLSLELNVDKACRQVHMVYTCTLLPTLSLELKVEMPGPCTSTDDFFCRNLIIGIQEMYCKKEKNSLCSFVV
jgi:hypothetical protein